MNVNQITQIKTWLPTIINVFMILAFVWAQAQWQKDVENKLETINEHVNDKDLHMPFKEKSIYFVPRSEIEIKMNNIELILLEIKSDIKELERNN